MKDRYLEAVSGLSLMQRRFLRAMVDGAQVLLTPGSSSYQAWQEDIASGRPTLIVSGLSKHDMVSMKLLLPMIEQGRSPYFGHEFFYIPASSRPLVHDLLTMTMQVPDALQFREQWLRQHGPAAAAPERPRMSA